jgi:D-alanyl-D-alanine dipeptidase
MLAVKRKDFPMHTHPFPAPILILCLTALAAATALAACQCAPENAGVPIASQPALDLVPLSEVESSIAIDVRYAGTDNFLGRPVRGYEGQREILIAREAALALSAVQFDVRGRGLGLKVYDAYRPQTAVDDFVEWSQDPADTLTKSFYYPDLDKPSLFELGYIAARSGHTLGYTVDLTLIDLQTGDELDMGSRFDYFGELSHHGADGLSDIQQANRMKLRSAMEAAGFSAYEKEWWHYRLVSQP